MGPAWARQMHHFEQVWFKICPGERLSVLKLIEIHLFQMLQIQEALYILFLFGQILPPEF